MAAEIVATEALTCTVCGRSSTLRDRFTVGKDGTAPRTWCPLCLEKRQRKIAGVTLACYLLVIPLAWLWIVADPGGRGASLVFVSSMYFTSRILMILPHELAHALTARMLGIPPITIHWGSGRPIFDRSVCGVRLWIGGNLRDGGLTELYARSRSGYRWRMFAVVAAGPLLNLVVGAVTLVFVRHEEPDGLSGPVKLMLLTFGVANLLMAFSNLWPRMVRAAGHRTQNDGARLLDLLKGNKTGASRIQRAGSHYQLASLSYLDRDFDRAIRHLRVAQALAKAPDLSAVCAALHAEALSESDRPALALELLEPLLARDDLSKGIHSRVEQAFAWAAFACDEPELLERGLVSIEESALLEPWSSVVLIKKICLLAATAATIPHRLESARSGLTELGRHELHGESRAYAALAQGLVAAAEGDGPAASRALAQARRLRATAAPLRVLERRIPSH